MPPMSARRAGGHARLHGARSTWRRSPTGFADRVDARSDLYALGVVLFDCLVQGDRAFAMPSGP